MPESVLDFEINAKLDDTFKKLMELLQGDKTITVKFQSSGAPPRDYYGSPAGYAAPRAPSTVGGVPSSLYNQLDVLYKRESVKYFKNFGDYNKIYKQTSSEMSQLLRGFVGIGGNLLKLLAGGAFGGAAGLLGGVMPLARSVVEDRRAALQLGGANMGKLKSAGLAFGNILNVPDEVSKIAGAQFNILDPAYRALINMGFSDAEIQGSDPSDLLAKALRVEKGRMSKYRDKETAVTIEGAQGVTNLFSPDALRTLYALPKGELEKRTEEYKERQKSLDLTQKEQQAIDELTRHISAAGGMIETVMEKNLAKMAPYLEKFSDFVADFVVNKIPHDPGGLEKKFGEGTLKDFIIPFFKMNEKIDKWFGDTFGSFFSGAKQKTEEEFTAALKEFTDWWKNNYGLTPAGAAIFGGGGESGGGGGGGGGGGRGAPASIRARTTAKGDIRFPSGATGGTGRKEPGLYATDVGLVATKGMNAAEAAFLDTLATGETPRGSYSNVSGDPGGLGGRYQFLLSTWNKEAALASVNPKDFSAENQDKVAWFYARSVVKGKTGADLDALLKTPEGVREAIAALSPGVWNAITNIDPDKSGHSGAVKLFLRKLKEEQAARPVKLPDDLRRAVAPQKKDGVNLPDLMQGVPPEWRKDKSTSMNNMKTFQGIDKQYAIKIDNPAGASYQVSGGMLGASYGNFGNG